MMTKFAAIKKGYRRASRCAKEERQRWKSVMAQVPEARKPMAMILLTPMASIARRQAHSGCATVSVCTVTR